MLYTVYDTTTGAVWGSGSVSGPAEAMLQAQDGRDVLLGVALDAATERVNLSTLEAETIDVRPQELLSLDVMRERERRLSIGFDYDFGDGRGVHRFGTSIADMTGWSEVTMLANAAINSGNPDIQIGIETETAPVAVTAMEWQYVLIAAGQYRQAIFARSFELQKMSPIPQNVIDIWEAE